MLSQKTISSTFFFISRCLGPNLFENSVQNGSKNDGFKTVSKLYKSKNVSFFISGLNINILPIFLAVSTKMSIKTPRHWTCYAGSPPEWRPTAPATATDHWRPSPGRRTCEAPWTCGALVMRIVGHLDVSWRKIDPKNSSNSKCDNKRTI